MLTKLCKPAIKIYCLRKIASGTAMSCVRVEINFKTRRNGILFANVFKMAVKISEKLFGSLQLF